MYTYILSTALFCLMADARRARDQGRELPKEPEDLTNLVYRTDTPTGLEACDDPRDEDEKFVRWQIEFGRNYKGLDEWMQRKKNWLKTNKEIRENNEASTFSGNPTAPFMDHNQYSDCDEQEKNHIMLGYRTPEDGQVRGTGEIDEDEKRRLKTLEDKKISYSSKIMGPVQNQGGCGSCWAFASLTPLEGTLVKRRIKAAKKAGKDHKSIKWRGLSKQHMVDCTFRDNRDDIMAKGISFDVVRNWGCNGGWMTGTWDFVKKFGSYWEEDYRPYTSGQTVEEGTCDHNIEDDHPVKVSYYVQTPANGYSMRQELKKAPLSVAIGVGSKLMNYRSGVIPKGDRSWCTDSLNHAVTVVGYTPGDVKENDEVMNVTQCRPAWQEDRYECRKAGETKVRGKYCCKDVEKTVQSSNGTFTLQNSWDTWWGTDGFYYAEFDDEGTGVCDMYIESYRVEPDMDQFIEYEDLADR